MYKKITKFLSARPMYNAVIHSILGAGIGILVTYPLIGEHPMRWGIGLIALGIAGHLYPLFSGKK